VRPDLPARVALYLRPASLDPRLERTRQAPAGEQPPQPRAPEPAGQALWSSSVWVPAAA